jgi:hypothetical protein
MLKKLLVLFANSFQGRKMRYVLVSTSSWLLLVDLQTRKCQPLESDRPDYYGISWFPAGDELVLTHSGLGGEDLVDITSYANSEKGWLTLGKLRSTPFLSAPHSITCAHDGRIVCANTGRNAITVYDFNKPNNFQEVKLSEPRWDRFNLDGVNGDHINSVFVKKERLYVLTHGLGLPSQLATFDYPDLNLLSVEKIKNRTGLHNIWITSEGQRISCHSNIGGLIDLDAQNTLWQSGSDVFTKGIAATDKCVIVGECEILSRAKRRTAIAGIWVIDKQNWKTIDYISLGPYGTVHDVRLLDVPDEAHHNYAFKNVGQLLEKDLLNDTSSARMKKALLFAQENQCWSGWNIILGSTKVDEAGAGDRGINLVINENARLGKLRFLYKLYTNRKESHFSIVTNYAGELDTNMIAILIEYGMKQNSISVWENGGKEWILKSKLSQIFRSPISSGMSVDISDHNLILKTDEGETFKYSSKEIGIDKFRPGIGLRWVNAFIKPTH